MALCAARALGFDLVAFDLLGTTSEAAKFTPKGRVHTVELGEQVAAYLVYLGRFLSGSFRISKGIMRRMSASVG